MIRFEQEVCGDLMAASSREWLETNGLGGFASSTINGLNTRRYHGLLVAATKPPVGRVVMLSKLEETLVVNGQRHELSTNQYPGIVHPQGFTNQTGFRLDPFPIFTYEVEGIVVEKSVFMVHGENTTVVQYQFQMQDAGSSPMHFEVRPLMAFRDYHSLGHESAALNRSVRSSEGALTIQPYADLPEMYMAHEADEHEEDGFWYRNFEYQIERERGFDFTEDLFSPFALRFDLNQPSRVSIIASTERRSASRADEYRMAEIERREKLVDLFPDHDELVRTLVAGSDQFIVARGTDKTVIAGYHWFGDWGRDTMIALPGLTLATGRFDVARSVLVEFARHVDRGMLPNRFPDVGEKPEYNTVDATLWYFEAIRSLVQYTGDSTFVRERLYEVLVNIIEWHVMGTRYNIQVRANGLLFSGDEGVQLTWMDAKVGDWVVTPRNGMAVEIQALWYNALKVMEGLAQEFGDDVKRVQYAAMAGHAQTSFNQLFWNEDSGCLFDVVNGDEKDASIRPNQVLAVSLFHSMVSREKAHRVMEVVERELLTPRGLRSLSPRDPEYRGRYEGDSLSRDGAYHQGTVWGWLMGPFVTAYLKAFADDPEARRKAKEWVAGFLTHISEAGLGQVSEIFDGDAPHTPRGCIAQAWSVGELLRVAIEDDLFAGPSRKRSRSIDDSNRNRSAARETHSQETLGNDLTFSETLLSWVERLTGLETMRVQEAIRKVTSWRINHIQREFLAQPSVDSAVALTLLSEAVDDLQRAGTPQSRVVTKLRNDVDVWPTWAELRAAALLLKSPGSDVFLKLEPNRHAGKHADFQITLAEGEEPINVEFKAVGLSDEETAFCGRMAPYLDLLIPPSGLVTGHARLSQQNIPMKDSEIADLHSLAAEWALRLGDSHAGLSGVVIVGHEGDSNYSRRLALRLRGEVLRQIPDGQRGWAGFYWTNGASMSEVCAHLNWDEIPENIEGIVLVGDAVAFPAALINSFRLILPRGADPEQKPFVASDASEELASLVFRRFEISSGVRPTLLTATTDRGKIELMRRDGRRRILPFNLIMDPDREGDFPRTGGRPPIWDE